MALKRLRERIKRERHVPLSFFARWRGAVRWDGGMSHDDGRSMHPHFLFEASKRKRPHPQGVCRIRKRHSRQRLRNARSKEKMPGANLHMRVSSLKTGVFRICADWNRESSTSSRHSPAFEVHFPAGSVWRRLRWRFRTPFASLSAGAALVLVENEGVEKAHLGKYE